MDLSEPKPNHGTNWKVSPLIAFVAMAAVIGVALVLLLPSNCVVEGTPVDTPRGPRPIEQLRPGDEVWTMDPTGARAIGRIVAVHRAWGSRHLDIALADGCSLRATGAHPVHARSGWSRVDALTRGQKVRCVHGWTAVSEVTAHTGSVRVFDLEVEPNHNFFAGGLLVHNKTSVRSANEKSARSALRELIHAEEIFRTNDRDANGKQDYWVGDVASLHFMKTGSGNLELIIKEYGSRSQDRPLAG